MNRAQLLGRLGGDHETRTTDKGDKVSSFRMATSEVWKEKEAF